MANKKKFPVKENQLTPDFDTSYTVCGLFLFFKGHPD
jgi:hypothetical protein